MIMNIRDFWNYRSAVLNLFEFTRGFILQGGISMLMKEEAKA